MTSAKPPEAKQMNLPEIATPKQVAEHLGTTVNSLAQDRYNKRGLPYTRFGGRIRYLRADVLDYLAANRVIPGSREVEE